MRKIYPYLTYAGAIPFIVCAFFIFFNIQQLPLFGSIDRIVSVYGLVISSFLAGSHWGQHLHIHAKEHLALPILSSIIAVLLWLGFLILHFKALMVMLAVAFMVLLFIDYRLFMHKLNAGHYFYMRCIVSLIVIVSLIISGMMS